MNFDETDFNYRKIKQFKIKHFSCRSCFENPKVRLKIINKIFLK